MTAYMLSAFLSVGTPEGYFLPDKDAPRYAAKALYMYWGLDKDVSRLEKKYIKIDKRPTLAYIGVVARVVSEKKISYTWRF